MTAVRVRDVGGRSSGCCMPRAATRPASYPAGIFAGVLLPPIAAAARPWLPEAMVAPIVATTTAWRHPAFALRCLVVVFALAIAMNVLATLLFARCGWRIAMTMGLATGFENVGLMVAALGARADDRTIVFLGLAQFPIYLLLLVLRPLVARWQRAEEARR